MNKAMLGYGLWQRRYGGAPDALGKMIRLPMGEFEVVGVMPAGHGFEAENLIVASVRNSLFSQAARTERAGLLAAYHERVLARLEAIPGVDSAAVTNSLPYTGGALRHGRLRVQGQAEEETQFLLPTAGADVSWDYFEAMRIPLTAGRFFERTDASDAAPVVIVNEVGARALFGERNPIGQMVQWGDTVGPANPYCRVVGVVSDVKHEGAERDAIELYYPFTQWPVGGGHYVLRTRLDQTAVASAIRDAVSVGLVAGQRRAVRIAELLRFGARPGHRDPVGARGDTRRRTGHGRSTRNGVGAARTRDRVRAFGGSSPNDRSLAGRCGSVRPDHLRVGGRLPGRSRAPGLAMAGRPRFAARPRTVTEERIAGESSETLQSACARASARLGGELTVATMTRWHVASRVLAAVAGGYAVSTVAGVGLAQALPLPRADAVMAGVLSTYLVYGAAVVWCFGARTAPHAWLGLLITGAFFAALGVLAGSVRS